MNEVYNEENAFGFSLMSEEDVKKKENELKDHLEKYTSEVNVTLDTMNKKLNGLRDMFMPILVDLGKNPEKDYIFWPGAKRTEAIKGFIDRINNFIAS